jgi:hypothetical protein
MPSTAQAIDIRSPEPAIDGNGNSTGPVAGGFQ